ncbi:hypothetical protein TrVFT333_011691 [Trichoderma virens FT-333]|nr:hypothetical protein TrVFT333_011691 [Trichoderma virens FT-333]
MSLFSVLEKVVDNTGAIVTKTLDGGLLGSITHDTADVLGKTVGGAESVLGKAVTAIPQTVGAINPMAATQARAAAPNQAAIAYPMANGYPAGPGGYPPQMMPMGYAPQMMPGGGYPPQMMPNPQYYMQGHGQYQGFPPQQHMNMGGQSPMPSPGPYGGQGWSSPNSGGMQGGYPHPGMQGGNGGMRPGY